MEIDSKNSGEEGNRSQLADLVETAAEASDLVSGLAMKGALAQLRAMYPEQYVSVEKKDGVWFHPTVGEGNEYHYYHILVGGKGWRKRTLEEALARATKP